MLKMKLLCLLVVLVATNSAYCVERHPHTCNAHCEFIELLIGHILGGRDENMRGDVADELAEYLQNFPQCGNDEEVIKDIAKLLTDENDAVKSGAAQALANIGPPAKAAIPALEQAFRLADEKEQASESVMLPSVSTAGVIRYALEHIKGPARSK